MILRIVYLIVGSIFAILLLIKMLQSKKYEEINKDCRDCKSITDDEKFNLHKQWYPKCYEKK